MASQKNENWERLGATGILTLSGSRGNYLRDPDFFDIEWLKARFSEPGLKGILIRGSGRHFSAGADLDALRQLARDKALLEMKMTAGKDLIRLIENTPLPVIAEIKGACFGGGLEIALACHVRICSSNALFAFPEINHGIMPGLGGTIRLPKLIGPGKAAEMMLAGDIINAGRALEIKLVDYIVPPNDLHDFSIKYLQKLTCERDVEVIKSVMKSIHNSLHMEFDAALEQETRLFCELALKK
jgi:enoyl-CoA hydratase